ncbi:YceI family protein [Aquimarina sp. 2201CG5-10]|uniref:YceI family protein n=1 Tax=Aquimarina callyspongiae TaxID=3098150 RepID=UPI002AB58F72|nr:YceI family protein [Aquimarina sp. 2201CG5-10]MDY8137984.1 YceI family protein [Aquimarina sp. 2201CG5-10]
MKKIFFIPLLMMTITTYAQKYFTKTGFTEFKASVETFEPVEAKNNSTTVVFKEDTGEIAALLFIKAFNFKIALMEEHFNENYMDSDIYPKATFKGEIVNYDPSFLSEKEKEYDLKGVLTIKGKSKEINTKIKLKTVNNTIILDSMFTVNPEGFNIKIPGIVRKKITKKIQINLHYELTKKG